MQEFAFPYKFRLLIDEVQNRNFEQTREGMILIHKYHKIEMPRGLKMVFFVAKKNKLQIFHSEIRFSLCPSNFLLVKFLFTNPSNCILGTEKLTKIGRMKSKEN